MSMDTKDLLPTHDDFAIDTKAKLAETIEAIAFLKSQGVSVPEEATEIRGILRRCIQAEAACKEACYYIERYWEFLVNPEEILFRDNLIETLRQYS